MKKRLWILAGAYASLILIGFGAWHTERLHVGTLAIVPLLIISYYSRLWPTLITAFVAGIALALLDRDVVRHPGVVQVGPGVDAIVLSLALTVAVFVAHMLRNSSVQNALLRDSLHQARRQAEHDPLTGAPNRTFFARHLRAAVASGKGTHVAVLFGDLDGFKIVNDTAGHAIGDRILTLAAERLQHAVRASDVVARIGGDEFAVIAERLATTNEVDHMIEQIERAFRDPFAIGEHRFMLGITIGISFYPEDGRDPESLLRISDARMYRKKAERREKSGHVPGASPI